MNTAPGRSPGCSRRAFARSAVTVSSVVMAGAAVRTLPRSTTVDSGGAWRQQRWLRSAWRSSALIRSSSSSNSPTAAAPRTPRARRAASTAASKVQAATSRPACCLPGRRQTRVRLGRGGGNRIGSAEPDGHRPVNALTGSAVERRSDVRTRVRTTPDETACETRAVGAETS